MRDVTVLPFDALEENQASPMDEERNNEEGQVTENQQIAVEEMQTDQPVQVPNSQLRRSQRPKRPALSNDYFIYLQEFEHDINTEEDMQLSSRPWKVANAHSGLQPWNLI
ncbi:hypothetical protein Prudu_009034 [Prunus dulcis]|uniref:Uncharacterized protein n=1 Tax=Prunus dulcis TaxID=3755 RepID=A0A4Y1R5F9_PRUDU|nr:hypothetical protein Prudu_009034 [Prunus dulcis]